MKAKVKKTDDEKTAELMLKSVKNVIASHYNNESYLAKKPNANSPTEEAVAVMMMGATGLFTSFMEAEEDNNIQVMAMTLRAVIEVHANVGYILSSEESERLSKRYLSTTGKVAEQFYALKTNKATPAGIWTRDSISSRVKKLNRSIYYRLWSFLSSYVHVDAGYLASYVSGYHKSLRFIFSSMVSMQFYEIFNLLEENKITKSQDTIHWVQSLKKELDTPTT